MSWGRKLRAGIPDDRVRSLEGKFDAFQAQTTQLEKDFLALTLLYKAETLR